MTIEREIQMQVERRSAIQDQLGNLDEKIKFLKRNAALLHGEKHAGDIAKIEGEIAKFTAEQEQLTKELEDLK
jgi:hypothetical protein